jgi:DNA helicase II / ATP-dependent DNA helicase PcrA
MSSKTPTTTSGEKARLLLLADPNQMIYGFKTGVTDARLDAARNRADAVEHTLPPGSHRDPTQVLPDAASEVRWRRFTTPPVSRAVEEGRLLVYGGVADDEDPRADAIVAEVARLRDEGHATIGIYAKTNTDAAGLSYALVERGLQHVPIGFSEAYGEALATMLLMVQYAAGTATWEDVRTALAITLAANVRSSTAPPLAIALRDGTGYPAALGDLLLTLADSLDAAGTDTATAVNVAVGSWNALGFLNGRRAWDRAGRTFASAAARARLDHDAELDRLSRVIAGFRDASFVELDAGDGGAIQLMNFSQTKGREADATILSYTSNDYYGRGGEPYDAPSRILYVSMTRARHKVVIMLPPNPHAVVSPFLRYAVNLP